MQVRVRVRTTKVYLVLLVGAVTLSFCSNTAAVADEVSNPAGAPPLAPAFSVTSAPDTNDSQPVLNNLSTLEFRLFARDYPDDDIVHRLDRLERVVYGARKTATIDARVADLMRDVVGAQTEAPIASTAAAISASSPSPGLNTSTGASTPAQSSLCRITASSQPSSLMDIIASMEMEVFGKTYSSEKLLDRVDRLEKSVLRSGTAQSFTPLPVRIHNLMLALQPAIHAPEVRNNNSLLQNSSDQLSSTLYNYSNGSNSGGTYLNGSNSSGAYPNGSNSSGTYPNGSNSSGTYPNGSNSSGTYPNGSYSGGTYPNGSYSGGTYPNRTYSSNNSSAQGNSFSSISTQSNEHRESEGHPIMKKLGKILSGVGTVAGEALGSMAYGSMLGYNTCGWGYPGYYGGWGGYCSPFGYYRW